MEKEIRRKQEDNVQPIKWSVRGIIKFGKSNFTRRGRSKQNTKRPNKNFVRRKRNNIKRYYNKKRRKWQIFSKLIHKYVQFCRRKCL